MSIDPCEKTLDRLYVVLEDRIGLLWPSTGRVDLLDGVLPVRGGVTGWVFSARDRMLIAFEGENVVHSFQISGRTVRWTGQKACGGGDASSLLVSPNGKYLVSLSPKSGTVSTFALMADGTLGDMVCHLPLQGKPGPNGIRQFWARPTDACFSERGDYLLVCDEGNDAVHLYQAQPNGSMTFVHAMLLRPASCPVEICRGEGDSFFVLSNGIESLYACRLDQKRRTLEPRQIVQPLPSFYTGLDVRCGGLRYVEKRGEVAFYVYGDGSLAGLGVKDGLVADKRWEKLGIALPPPVYTAKRVMVFEDGHLLLPSPETGGSRVLTIGRRVTAACYGNGGDGHESV